MCLASMLKLDIAMVLLDLKSGQQKSAEFLSLNALGQVPVLVDEQLVLSDSHAILAYLALRYDPDHTWYPQAPEQQAKIQRFLALSAGEICQGPNLYRGIKALGKSGDLELAYHRTTAVFSFLDQHLKNNQWLVGNFPTIADVAIYSYLALAVKAGFPLADFTNTATWLERFEQLPGFINTADK